MPLDVLVLEMQAVAAVYQPAVVSKQGYLSGYIVQESDQCSLHDISKYGSEAKVLLSFEFAQTWFTHVPKPPMIKTAGLSSAGAAEPSVAAISNN